MSKIDQLRAALAATTPGVWVREDSRVHLSSGGRPTTVTVAQCYVTGSNMDTFPRDNAEFIAIAHNMAPELLAVVSAAKEVIRHRRRDFLDNEAYPYRDLRVALDALEA